MERWRESVLCPQTGRAVAPRVTWERCGRALIAQSPRWWNSADVHTHRAHPPHPASTQVAGCVPDPRLRAERSRYPRLLAL